MITQAFTPGRFQSFISLQVLTRTITVQPTRLIKSITPGMARISLLVANVVRELATAIEPPAYLEVASKPFMGGGGDRPYFGSIPDFAKPGGGYAITGFQKSHLLPKQASKVVMSLCDWAKARLRGSRILTVLFVSTRQERRFLWLFSETVKR